MLSAITVANFFVNKGLENNKEDMTPMKVLKLSYIAYGWYLALFDKKLFNESIQAWQYGPVIPGVYNAFKSYGNSRISSPFLNGEIIPNDIEKFLNKIWEVYNAYSGWQLSAITHQPNTPWSKTWQGIPNAVISDEIIKTHYLELARR
ncbi:Panacea domain-containing protein [Neisseria animalis]|uniref:DUF4065 domain-containing protein n=1 Tax=Neisseria animalis TaxID=492 RepID=A0A5P3MQR8_NEIAN|nr:type II toxin-antitoxin system antitoxin SocA domain-containing protein [Neisseria animalis]QEY23943.1 DUF4065 domain-containing protein [Neisseria animalis]ROW31659.1 DUF4065 domain-containing protein [Neisseria animalis]VEE05920.1 phage associated protein [Neisseria animalis]